MARFLARRVRAVALALAACACAMASSSWSPLAPPLARATASPFAMRARRLSRQQVWVSESRDTVLCGVLLPFVSSVGLLVCLLYVLLVVQGNECLQRLGCLLGALRGRGTTIWGAWRVRHGAMMLLLLL